MSITCVSVNTQGLILVAVNQCDAMDDCLSKVVETLRQVLPPTLNSEKAGDGTFCPLPRMVAECLEELMKIFGQFLEARDRDT